VFGSDKSSLLGEKMAAFYLLLAENIEFFALIVISVFGLFYYLFRKHIYSIFDPVLYYLVFTETFCSAVVIFMGVYQLIEYSLLMQYLLSETALFVGVLAFRPRTPSRKIKNPIEQTELLGVLFSLCFLLFISLNIFVYATRGIPLLVENRLDIYTIGGGFGFISRVFDVLLIIIIYYLLEQFRKGLWRLREWSFLFTTIGFQVLSGAKSAVLTIVFVAALYAIYHGLVGVKAAQINKLLKKLFALAVLGFILVTQIQISEIEIAGKKLTLLDQMAFRIVNNGDAFIYAYPNRVIDELDGSRPIASLFSEYLAFLRIESPENLPTHAGSQLAKYYYGPETTSQTNAKHNIFGYMSFGFLGSMIYSGILGVLIGFVRYKLFRRNTNAHLLLGLLYIQLNLSVIIAISDWDNLSRAILNIFFVFFPLYFLADVIWHAIYRPIRQAISTSAMPSINKYQP
jgi:hypothetical protein